MELSIVSSVYNAQNCLEQLIKKIKFYKKFGWKLLNKKKFKVLDFNFKTSGMIYNNFKKVSLDNLKFFLYRKK